jgi:DNA-binding XRE family transcriptional regulator
MTVNSILTVAFISFRSQRVPMLVELMITPAQIRAARAMLSWKQTDLAARAGVSEMSVKNIEREATDPRASTLRAIQSALEEGGIQFIEGNYSGPGGPGLRIKS